MVKRLLQIIICAFVMSVPVCGATYSYDTADQVEITQAEKISITVKGRQVRVQQAQGATLEVYSVTGAKVMSVKLDSADQTLQLKLGRGCYIIKVRDVARKISLL